jgi:hypothetical protein
MKIIDMKFEVDGVEYSWQTDHDGCSGMLFSKAGASLATIELVKAMKPVKGKRRSKYWVVHNWDGGKKVPGEARYAHPQLGDLLHSSNFKPGDAVAMASHTLQTFLVHGWVGRRRRKS